MRRFLAIMAVTCGIGWDGQAAGQGQLLDLRQPSVVVGALQQGGYKAVLKQNSKGEPYVLSGTNGSDFTIEFYGCTATGGQGDCGSYQFTSWYKPEPIFTAEFANEWNSPNAS